eukprot:7514514-Pyramimonas_sp.AAC.2
MAPRAAGGQSIAKRSFTIQEVCGNAHALAGSVKKFKLTTSKRRMRPVQVLGHWTSKALVSDPRSWSVYRSILHRVTMFAWVSRIYSNIACVAFSRPSEAFSTSPPSLAAT